MTIRTSSIRSDLRRYVDLVRVSAERNLKSRYRGSVLGVLWSLSNPLLMTAVYTVIFGAAFSNYYGSIGNYVLACFTGLVVLNFFSQTTGQALSSIVASGGLLNKIAVPPSIFPASVVAANLFQYCVAVLPVLVVVTLVQTHRLDHLVALVVPSLALLLATAGFSLLTASLFVYFRDLPYLWELVVFVLWITSPVFYPAALVPAPLRPYINLNPLAAIMSSFRQLALSHDAASPKLLAITLAAGAMSLVIGIIVYRIARRDLMDLV